MHIPLWVVSDLILRAYIHFSESLSLRISLEVKGKPGGNPEPGDRLRFVFVFVSCVACVRAGEAKLRVRARCRVFLLGQPRLWEVVLRSSRPLCEAQDVVCVGVVKKTMSKSVPGCAQCACLVGAS